MTTGSDDQTQPYGDTSHNGHGIVRHQFQGDEMMAQHETAAIAIAAAEKAAIESRYILAMRCPRDWDTVRERLKKECRRPGFADSAIYRKPVGGKTIEGLSVRFAEAAIRHVTNFYSSAKSIYDDPGKSIVRITVMDLESNSTIEIDVNVPKTVERKSLKAGQRPLGQRVNSFGDQVFIVPATDDEVLNKTNAMISKALRNGVLRLLPGDIQDECEALCRKTQLARDKEDPDAAKRALFDAFASIGILPTALKEYLGSTAETLQPAELAELRAVFSAIRDGDTTWAAVYEAKHPPAGTGDKPAPKTEAAAKTEALIAEHKVKAEAKAAAKKSAEKAEAPRAPAAGSDGAPEPGANG